MNKKLQKKSTRSDVSGGEEMSEKKTLPKKPIQTIYGEVGESEEERKAYYFEVSNVENQRITNAQTRLHSRLSEEDRARAYTWTYYFQGLIEGDDK